VTEPLGALPDLAEALGWNGRELDDAAGRSVGRVTGIYVDAQAGRPVWLVVAMGRRRRAKAVIVPLRECAAMPGRVWTAQDRQAMREAPAVDPARPLLREHETAICSHYRIGPEAGRHAEVVGRAAGSITAEPA
jgi:PRC-barrel domain